MKAIVRTSYGPPGVLQLKEVEKPAPRDNEVLIKVYAATVNRTDCGILRAKPFIIRLFTGLKNPNKQITGKSTFGKCKPLLKPGGVYMSSDLGSMAQNPLLALLAPIAGSKKVKFPLPFNIKESILFIKKLIEEGKFKAVIDKVYSLHDIVDAYKYVETGQKTGNVIIRMDHNN